ncbi:hypothetical protein X975_27223, partial [Stegodyphus mimosarum]
MDCIENCISFTGLKKNLSRPLSSAYFGHYDYFIPTGNLSSAFGKSTAKKRSMSSLCKQTNFFNDLLQQLKQPNEGVAVARCSLPWMPKSKQEAKQQVLPACHVANQDKLEVKSAHSSRKRTKY